MKEYDLRERAEIVKLAQECAKTLKAGPLIEYFEQRAETASAVDTIVIGETLTKPICSCFNPEYDTGYKCVNCGRYKLEFAQGECQ